MEKGDKLSPIIVLKNILIGVILGVANIIPGVSAGTMAIVTGVYQKLIGIFTLNFKFIKQEWKFILVLGIGAIGGIFAFSKLIEYLLANFNLPTNAFFIGVVLGTCPLIGKKTYVGRGIKASTLIPGILTLALMVVLVVAENSGEELDVAVITDINVGSFLQIAGAMAVAAMAMIVPGISGSFIALALGVYPTVINAISNLNVIVLIPVGIGVVIGLVGGAKLIDYLLKKAPGATYSAIMGLLIGSVVTLAYPLVPQISGFGADVIVSLVVLVAGIVISYMFSRSVKDE